MSPGRDPGKAGVTQDADAATLRETAPAVTDEDFYMDGPFLVFTEAYHLKRGYCCGSACRHCPYGGEVSGLESLG